MLFNIQGGKFLCYNSGMKKFLLSLILISAVCCTNMSFANEIEEDYLDIAADYCIAGDYNSAMEYLDKILLINPENIQVRDLKKGLNHIILQDKKSYVTNINPLITQAMGYKKSGSEVSEESALIQAAKGNNAYLAYYYLGNFYRSKKDYLKALDSYNSSVSSRPDFAQAYLATAVVLYDIGNFQAVLNPIDKYLTFNPKDDLAYAIKSRAEFALGMLEQSRHDNDRALEINDCPEYQFDRAKILYKYEAYKDSKDLFTGLLDEIQTSKIYEYMALCDIGMGNYNSALLNLDKAIILSDDDEFLENKYNEVKEILENN